MYQKFLTKTIESKFIKNLLYNTPLPLYKTVRDGDYVFSNRIYIYKDQIIKVDEGGAGYINLYTWKTYSIIPEEVELYFTEEITTAGVIWYSEELYIDKGRYQLKNPVCLDLCPEEGKITFEEVAQTLTNKFITTLFNDKPVVRKCRIVSECKNLNTTQASIICYVNSVTPVKNTLDYLGDITSTNPNRYEIDGIYLDMWVTLNTESANIAKYIPIANYHFGAYYPQYTEKILSRYGYYDSDTHEALGKYLRCLRNIHDVDLMPFYNCYSGRMAENFYIQTNHTYADEALTHRVPVYNILNTPTTNYKLFQIPIKFNQEYTIALDADCAVIMAPAFIKNGRFVTVYDDNKNAINLTKVLNKEALYFDNFRYRDPLVYKIDLKESDAESYYLDMNEQNLYLLIQISATADTTLTVLEGNYIATDKTQYIYDFWELKEESTEYHDKIFLSKLNLLKINDKNSYAFSDRLIEYLTLNVINPLDTIDKNTVLAQQVANLAYSQYVSPGVWSYILRKRIYDRSIASNNVEHYDLNGYVDKTVEKNFPN